MLTEILKSESLKSSNAMQEAHSSDGSDGSDEPYLVQLVRGLGCTGWCGYPGRIYPYLEHSIADVRGQAVVRIPKYYIQIEMQ
jgi:hypothetical protein